MEDYSLYETMACEDFVGPLGAIAPFSLSGARHMF